MDFNRFKDEICDNCTKKAQGKCDGKIIVKIDGTFACVEDDE